MIKYHDLTIYIYTHIYNIYVYIDIDIPMINISVPQIPCLRAPAFEVVYFFDPAKALTPKETHFVLHAVKAAVKRWRLGDDWEMGDEWPIHGIKKKDMSYVWCVDWVTVGPWFGKSMLLVETHLPSTMNARVYVNLLEGWDINLILMGYE